MNKDTVKYYAWENLCIQATGLIEAIKLKLVDINNLDESDTELLKEICSFIEKLKDYSKGYYDVVKEVKNLDLETLQKYSNNLSNKMIIDKELNELYKFFDDLSIICYYKNNKN